MHTILDDDHNSKVGRTLLNVFRQDEVTPDLMMVCHGGIAPWMASITFGGPKPARVYVGSLRGTRIPWFKPPVPGLPMIHWQEQTS